MKWLGRIAGIVVGLFAIIFGLVAIFGDAVLPKCDDKETKDVMGEIIAQRTASMPVKVTAEAAKSGLQVDGITEVTFDEEKQVRTCKAAVSLKSGDTPIFDKLKVSYTITWRDRKEKTFQVEMRSE